MRHREQATKLGAAAEATTPNLMDAPGRNLESEEGSKRDEQLAKIAVSKEADRAIADFFGRVVDGFDAGRPTKHEIASQMLLRFAKQCTDSDVQTIRSLFFDPIVVMETMIRRAKATGEVPDALRSFLFDQFANSSAAQSPARRNKKILKTDVIIDNSLTSEVAS